MITSQLGKPNHVLLRQTSIHCAWVNLTFPVVQFIGWECKVKWSGIAITAMLAEEGLFGLF